ncbi:MAG: TonB-dependent receptor, partial [Sphingobacteriaceae bacterium]
MNKIFLFLAVIFLSGKAFAQTPVTGREVSGIVKDSTDNAVIGAVVVLTTSSDSVKVNTNNNGFFIFKNIKAGQFTISVRSIGYRSFNKRFLYNDGTSKLVLDPIILKESSSLLNTVTINGTPSIVYKEDTVEYRASDYVVKANASVEDLIKKMEGVEVGNDGSVTHQGIAVARAKINGKNVGGADLANTIQNLPAEIVEKIQMVDDYGDQATRTGIKDGDPERILNIVTRADRSVGNRLQADAGAGNNDRYSARLNLTRFNGNQQIFARNNFNNTITGVAGANQGDGGSRGGGSGAVNSGGLNTSGGATISYSDKWSKELEFDGSYSFNGRNSTATNNSETTQYNQKFGNVFIVNDGDSESKRNSHDLDARLRFEIDSSNFLQISPSVEFTSTNNSNFANINQSGGIKQDRENLSGSESSAPDYGLTTLYSHNFSKKGRVFSTQLTFKSNNSDQDRTSENEYKFYDPITGDFLKDSIVNLFINNGNKTTNYRASVTFSEPITSTSRLEFNGQINRREYDNSQITDSIDKDGIYHREYSLSKIYNYAFTEQRYALNYRYLKGRYNVSLGVTAVPALLSGFSETLNTSTDRYSFNVIPIARFEYQWSRQKRFKLNYTGNPQEPSFNQIQDVPDLSNPQNPIYGNPGLSAQFRHTINSSFNNYVANSRLNFSVNVQATMTDNKVIRNTIELDKSRGSRATYFTNANGDYSTNANYNISKQFADRKYRVGLNGTVNFANSVSMLNGNTN